MKGHMFRASRVVGQIWPWLRLADIGTWVKQAALIVGGSGVVGRLAHQGKAPEYRTVILVQHIEQVPREWSSGTCFFAITPERGQQVYL